mmetsp:Transcript_8271/g.21171  ORF Transcript_8271/g.21171 Transcript_8271/m.21171 type:complete len:114 (+) Transcript_8271:136-477(+)
MGIGKGYGKYSSKLVEDAVAFARGSGYGHKDKTELERVADGTHEELWRDRTVGAHAANACEKWMEGLLPMVKEKFEDMLMDGETLNDLICVEHLQLCRDLKDPNDAGIAPEEL